MEHGQVLWHFPKGLDIPYNKYEILEEGLYLCWESILSQTPSKSTYQERHKQYTHRIIKIVPVDTLAKGKTAKLNGHAHLEINFSRMVFHLETYQSTVLSECLRVLSSWFPNKPQERSQKPQF